MCFCMINPECLYFNDDVAWLRFRLGHFLDDQTIQTMTKVIYNDGTQVKSLSFRLQLVYRDWQQPLCRRIDVQKNVFS